MCVPESILGNCGYVVMCDSLAEVGELSFLFQVLMHPLLLGCVLLREIIEEGILCCALLLAVQTNGVFLVNSMSLRV